MFMENDNQFSFIRVSISSDLIPADLPYQVGLLNSSVQLDNLLKSDSFDKTNAYHRIQYTAGFNGELVMCIIDVNFVI